MTERERRALRQAQREAAMAMEEARGTGGKPAPPPAKDVAHMDESEPVATPEMVEEIVDELVESDEEMEDAEESSEDA